MFLKVKKTSPKSETAPQKVYHPHPHPYLTSSLTSHPQPHTGPVLFSNLHSHPNTHRNSKHAPPHLCYSRTTKSMTILKNWELIIHHGTHNTPVLFNKNNTLTITLPLQPTHFCLYLLRGTVIT